MTIHYLEKDFQAKNGMLHYYEVENNNPQLVMIHSQSVNSLTFEGVWKELSKKYHIYAVDCYGHGKSSHDSKQYNIKAIGDAIIEFMEQVVPDKSVVTGHSSGGLLAAYIGAYSQKCKKLILEDPPLFACQGERRYKTYNYLDLSSVCHEYIQKKCKEDFVAYYFERQKMWEFFPEKSRDKIKLRMTTMAWKNRKKHPEGDLSIPFWPRKALQSYKGMNQYDPSFGEAFYKDSFHAGIAHEDMLKQINCPTILMKAKTNYSPDGVLLAAMSDEDAKRAGQLIGDCQIVAFACGHGIHIEKEKEFLQCF